MSARGDESCDAWHRLNQPGTESACVDAQHVVRHHVTTPFFVRAGIIDSLLSGNYEESGVRDPVLGPFGRNALGVPLVFATVLARELRMFSQLPSTAEEGSLITRGPGVFAPSCAIHDTIHSNNQVFGATITPDGGSPKRFFDVFGAWRDAGVPSTVVSQDPMRLDTFCP